MALNIDEVDVGNEYLDAIDAVIKVRVDRKKLYESTFLDDSFDFLTMKIEDKLKRAKMNLKNYNNAKGSYENSIDSFIDLCNYALFAIAKLQKGDKC